MKRAIDTIIAISNSFGQEIVEIFRDKGVLIFLFLLPLAYPLVYSLIYNPELVKDVSIVVVDNDRSAKSRELVRKFDATQEAKVKGYASNIEEAKRAMYGHECYGILYIPDEFERKIARMEQSPAIVYSDVSLMLRYKALLVASTNVSEQMGIDIRNEQSHLRGEENSFGGRDLLPSSSIVMGNIEGGFDSFIMPGVLVLILHQCIILAVGMRGGAINETRRRVKLGKQSVKRLIEGIIGRSLSYLLMVMVSSIYLLYFVPLMFSFPMSGNLIGELLYLLPMSISCIFIGIAMQGVVKERESVFLIWVMTSMLFIFLSGLTWPRYAMPEMWQIVGSIVPATWGIDGFVLMNSNGSTLSQVSDMYVNLWLLSALYIVIAILVEIGVNKQKRSDIID